MVILFANRANWEQVKHSGGRWNHMLQGDFITVDGLTLWYSFCLIVLCLDIKWLLGLCCKSTWEWENFGYLYFSLVSFTHHLHVALALVPGAGWEAISLTQWLTRENEPWLKRACFGIPLDWVFCNTEPITYFFYETTIQG